MLPLTTQPGGYRRGLPDSEERLYSERTRMVDLMMKYGDKVIKKAKLELWDNPTPLTGEGRNRLRPLARGGEIDIDGSSF